MGEPSAANPLPIRAVFYGSGEVSKDNTQSTKFKDKDSGRVFLGASTKSFEELTTDEKVSLIAATPLKYNSQLSFLEKFRYIRLNVKDLKGEDQYLKVSIFSLFKRAIHNWNDTKTLIKPLMTRNEQAIQNKIQRLAEAKLEKTVVLADKIVDLLKGKQLNSNKEVSAATGEILNNLPEGMKLSELAKDPIARTILSNDPAAKKVLDLHEKMIAAATFLYQNRGELNGIIKVDTFMKNQQLPLLFLINDPEAREIIFKSSILRTVIHNYINVNQGSDLQEQINILRVQFDTYIANKIVDLLKGKQLNSDEDISTATGEIVKQLSDQGMKLSELANDPIAWAILSNDPAAKKVLDLHEKMIAAATFLYQNRGELNDIIKVDTFMKNQQLSLLFLINDSEAREIIFKSSMLRTVIHNYINVNQGSDLQINILRAQLDTYIANRYTQQKAIANKIVDLLKGKQLNSNEEVSAATGEIVKQLSDQGMKLSELANNPIAWAILSNDPAAKKVLDLHEKMIAAAIFLYENRGELNGTAEDNLIRVSRFLTDRGLSLRFLINDPDVREIIFQSSTLRTVIHNYVNYDINSLNQGQIDILRKQLAIYTASFLLQAFIKHMTKMSPIETAPIILSIIAPFGVKDLLKTPETKAIVKKNELLLATLEFTELLFQANTSRGTPPKSTPSPKPAQASEEPKEARGQSHRQHIEAAKQVARNDAQAANMGLQKGGLLTMLNIDELIPRNELANLQPEDLQLGEDGRVQSPKGQKFNKAMRKMQLEHHSDRGGDPEQFQRVALLIDFTRQGVIQDYIQEYAREKQRLRQSPLA